MMAFHTLCMEQTCGAPLDMVSALFWEGTEAASRHVEAGDSAELEHKGSFAGPVYCSDDDLTKVLLCFFRSLHLSAHSFLIHL